MVHDLPCEQVLPRLRGQCAKSRCHSPTLDQLRNRRLSLEPGRHFHFKQETVTLVRSDLSKVVTDQKHDEQFFHEGSHV